MIWDLICLIGGTAYHLPHIRHWWDCLPSSPLCVRVNLDIRSSADSSPGILDHIDQPLDVSIRDYFVWTGDSFILVWKYFILHNHKQNRLGSMFNTMGTICKFTISQKNIVLTIHPFIIFSTPFLSHKKSILIYWFRN